ncbi:hypothetical protein [Rhodothermus marinus]|uniref:hypothetical protein n=1 Tax=Rhodothermus marinus TaxID=29549 RepID=UPI0001A30FC9|nr:hypothetical protein [Rhodothermus marinus]
MRSVIATLITLVILNGRVGQAQPLPDTLRLRYEAVAQRIIKAALADSSAFERLAYLVDTFGPRFSGTPQLERAIDWVLEAMRGMAWKTSGAIR